MYKPIFNSVFLVAILVIQGCATNVVYSEVDRNSQKLLSSNKTSMFIDRNGDLYPPHTVSMNNSMFTSSRDDTASLRSYFSDRSNKKEWIMLLNELGISEAGSFDKRWADVQSKLTSRLAKTISEGSEKGLRHIVFLVHGYNNEYSDAKQWYELIEQDIVSRVKQRWDRAPYFVRVHWDGLSQAIPVSIWTKAQYNGPLAGLSIRQLLGKLNSQVSKDTNLIMISHSTGALVVVNAVGNGSKPLECEGDFAKHCLAIQESDSLTPLVSNVRLGILIPAASSMTFDSFKSNEILPEAIILGLNKQDFPTNKFFWCSLLGSTCLNVKVDKTCSESSALFSGSDIDFAAFEFSNSIRNENQTTLFWETHSVQDQMKRDKWEHFIERVLFEPSDAKIQEHVYCELET